MSLTDSPMINIAEFTASGTTWPYGRFNINVTMSCGRTKYHYDEVYSTIIICQVKLLFCG